MVLTIEFTPLTGSKLWSDELVSQCDLEPPLESTKGLTAAPGTEAFSSKQSAEEPPLTH